MTTSPKLHPIHSIHLIHPLTSASRTASAVAASLAMASSVALRASANSWAIRVRKSQCASSLGFSGGQKKSVLVFVFFPKEKRHLCETSVSVGGKKTHFPDNQRWNKTTIQTKKCWVEFVRIRKKTVSQTTKKGWFPLIWGLAPPKILTNRVASKQNILGHVWEFCSLSRIHGYWICSKKKPGPFFSLESCGPPPKKKSSGRSEFSLTFCWVVFLVGDVFLVGGFNPSEKYYSNWIISPSRGENKKYLSCHHLVFVVCGVCSLSIPQENQNRNSFRPVGVSWAAFSRASLMSAV